MGAVLKAILLIAESRGCYQSLLNEGGDEGGPFTSVKVYIEKAVVLGEELPGSVVLLVAKKSRRRTTGNGWTPSVKISVFGMYIQRLTTESC